MTQQYFIFMLDKRLYALHLHAVVRALRAVEVTPLPGAPEIVLGVINVEGKIVPVVNLRKRFRLPEKEISASDTLILARTSRREITLVADEVKGVIEREAREIVAAETVFPGNAYVEGIVKVEGEITLIHNLDRFLLLDEACLLESALSQEP